MVGGVSCSRGWGLLCPHAVGRGMGEVGVWLEGGSCGFTQGWRFWVQGGAGEW